MLRFAYIKYSAATAARVIAEHLAIGGSVAAHVRDHRDQRSPGEDQRE
jgi:hypothetical protein